MAKDATIKKGFVNVSHGQVHYRMAGSGPPVILLHDSPRSSMLHVPLLKELADQFTAIAVDTPGYGSSTPLEPGRQLEIPDFGTALAETIAALGIERCPVYGYHTSSKIALAFAVKHPEHVSVAVLNGLSLPVGGAEPAFIESYMRPFRITDSGGYLAEEWTRVLDFQRWFPWFAKTKEARLPHMGRDMEGLHQYGMDLFMAGPHFSDAYAAAMRFAALPFISQLKTPTVILAQQDDVLHAYLNALPNPLPAGVTKESLAVGAGVLRKRLREILAQYSDAAGAASFTPPDPLKQMGPLKQTGKPGVLTCGYVNFPHGQVLVRRAGNAAAGRPIVFLSDLPGSSRQDADLLLALAKDRPVYAIDLPGSGESSPLAQPTPQAYADVIARTLESLDLKQVDLIAEGMSTPLAVCFAASHAGQVRAMILDAVTNADIDLRTEMRINYTPDLRPTREGLHLHRAFHMLRDQEVQWPWYDESTPAIRKVTPRIRGERLHVRLVDTLKQYAAYGDAIHAALDIDMAALLPAVGAKTLVCTVPDDVRYGMAAKTVSLLKSAATIVRPQNVPERAGVFLSALAE
ncbi:MAG: alpha/beta hydrolase [Rhodospirillaceae bacterium]|nr:alpha/beta hydrolase [Rhodospirillaceae bacterium]